MIRGALKITISHIPIYIYIRVGLPAVRPHCKSILVKNWSKILSRRVRALGSAGAWWVRSVCTGVRTSVYAIIYRFYQFMTDF